MAARRNLEVDRKKFLQLMGEHENISRRAGYMDSVMAEGPLDAIRKTTGGTDFLGYDTTEAEAEIVGIIAEKRLVEELTEVGHDSPVGVVLDRTPFYGEAGGQVGDMGTLCGGGLRVSSPGHPERRRTGAAYRALENRQLEARRPGESHRGIGPPGRDSPGSLGDAFIASCSPQDRGRKSHAAGLQGGKRSPQVRLRPQPGADQAGTGAGRGHHQHQDRRGLADSQPR
jgi:hypothetical protein